MKKIVVLTGAGMSAESGITTFRDSNGLWEQFRVEDVASIEGYERNPQLVLQFYNDRRRQLADVEPCAGHRLLAEMERDYQMVIVTQNVDNLHERAGSTNVIHLHGELTKATSSSIRRAKGFLHVIRMTRVVLWIFRWAMRSAGAIRPRTGRSCVRLSCGLASRYR